MRSPSQNDAQIIVIGNPANRRVALFCDAARRLGLPTPIVISYSSLLADDCQAIQAIATADIVRIESPGEDESIERRLIARGAAVLSAIDRESGDKQFPDEPIEFGRIYHPQLWYAGYCDLLQWFERLLEQRSIAWMNHPQDIQLHFDKAACQGYLSQNGVSTPRILDPAPDYVSLRARMREAGVSQVFVKLNHGSSASGVVAFRTSGQRVSAITSVEIVRDGASPKLFNSLHLRHYRDEREVAELFNALCPLGVHVEQWMPKASSQGGVFDLRVLVIGGELRHVVMRVADGPMTNLHLGNRRGNFETLAATMLPVDLEAAWDTCRRVAGLFPRSLYLGIDLMFSPKFKRHYVLEVNAFGDLLPGILHDGEDTYTAELRSHARLLHGT